MAVNRVELARRIDHTLLKPEARPADVAALVAEAARLGVWAVCISPSMLPVRAGGLHVAATVGFPSGKHATPIKVAEARLAVGEGADELDMVIDVGAALAGAYDSVRADIAAVRAAAPAPTLLKVILETAVLSDDAIVQLCRVVEEAGADFVKTSTGFHPAGGATTHAVELMAKAVGGRLGVKASGGIHTASQALDMLSAGATRLGLSHTADVLRGMPD